MTSAKDDYNPFEDPSIKVLTDQSTNSQVTVGSYNPFDKSISNKQTVSAGGDHTVNIPSPQPTVVTQPPPPPVEMSQPVEPPPPYENSGAQKIIPSDLQRRQEELERKANELQAREAQLNAAPTGSVKNWPPLPAKCCVGPCFYQDISVEIPDAYQKTVRIMYYLWIFYAFLLLLNMFGALALFIADSEGTTFGVSILVFLLFSPLSFVCWFRPVYKAFRSDSSFNFMVFFFVFFFQFLIAVFYTVGIPGLGSCGLLNGITTLSKKESAVSNYTVGIIAIFIGFLWAIYAMMSFYMLVKIHRMYRGTTASFAKAQEELATGVMRNPQVQTAAATAVTQAAQQTFNQAASGLRY
ncbi:Secretory carrier-associated membrane protein 1 [Araneus ventricosus]|uniref:Secretory carrier-associated membrane protein n=1 Tax=Araneus ventricosus TaxID=182803 RepID=A0A4Y2K8R5_ARAVE|nr:Secretory carrier-associated membrane protein 1 [Araneus ventricosus]